MGVVAGPCWLGKVGCLGNHPLQDAGVFPASGDQVTVVVQEGNVGHVTAVTTVLVARSLEGKQKKRKNEFLTQGAKKWGVIFHDN